MGAHGMTRRQDWEGRLFRAFLMWKDKPFAWGKHDCFTWGSDVELAVTGRMTFVDILGSYNTERQAMMVLARNGWTSVGDAASERLLEIKPGFARRGDLASIKAEDRREAMGVVLGEHLAAVTLEGLKLFPRDNAIRAWRNG